MTAQAEIFRQSDLINQLVLDRQTLEELGRVETLWMYPPVHRVLGFICKSGFLGNTKSAFKLSQIAAVGASGVLTYPPSEPTEAKKVQQLESLIQHEVWSNEGNQLGKITDYLFELESGKIKAYLFVSSGWAGVIGEIYELRPADITSFGKKRVLVAESDTDRFAIYQEGISQKLTKAKDSLAQEASEELRSLTQRAETLTEQVTEKVMGRFQSLTEQAKASAQMLSQKAKEKAQVLNEQLGEQLDAGQEDLDTPAETRTFSDRANETRQTLAEEIKERSHSLSKQLGASFQTLTVHAEEIFETVRENSGFEAGSPQSGRENSGFEVGSPQPGAKEDTRTGMIDSPDDLPDDLLADNSLDDSLDDWSDDAWMNDDWTDDAPNLKTEPDHKVDKRYQLDDADLDDEPWI